MKSEGIELFNNNMIARNMKDGYNYVLSKNAYKSGITVFSLKINKIHKINWLLIGIIPYNAVLKNNSYTIPGTYGWNKSGYADLNGSTYEQGKDGYDARSDFLENDTIDLILNLKIGRLTFKNKRNGKEFFLNIPNDEYRLHINFHYSQDEIEILKIESFIE